MPERTILSFSQLFSEMSESSKLRINTERRSGGGANVTSDRMLLRYNGCIQGVPTQECIQDVPTQGVYPAYTQLVHTRHIPSWCIPGFNTVLLVEPGFINNP